MSKKECTIAIVGRPNVGKSTLLNAILKQKLAIVSYKPQTTRNQIKGIFENNNLKIVFIDTPGYHEPKNKLDQFLNSQVKSSFKQADIVLFLIDSTRTINEEDIKIAQLIKGYDVSKIIVIATKNDSDKKILSSDDLNQVLEIIKPIKTYTSFISSNSLQDINNLISMIHDIAPNQGNFTNELIENDNFLISEIVREQALLNLRQEVPHSIAVYVEQNKFDKENNQLIIDATIVVEKESQKPIVIGKGGATIKLIGTKARMELLKIFDCKIRLNLFVKVEKDWRDNEQTLKSLGYYK